MAEKKVGMHGLSIVDATNNDGSLEEDDKTFTDKEKLVVQIEEAEAVDHDEGCEESLDSFLEEADEKINLLDALEEKEEADKENKYPQQNSTLIITTEEHLDSTAFEDTLNTTTETVKNESINAKSNLEETKKLKPRNEDQTCFWVSNITRHVKATDLKKFFSQIGKVLTAKVLTNGRSYFGYVSVDSADTVSKCIRQLNNTLFEGKRVTVSKERPDLREAKSTFKPESRRRKNEKIELKESKSAESKVTVEGNRVKLNQEEDSRANEIAELNKKLDRCKAEINRYKYKMSEYQRRHDGMRKKCTSLEKELKDVQYQLRSDRRRLNQDKEEFEKSKKLEIIRLEADKALVTKEVTEVKKLREQLKAKIDELGAQSKKNAKRRGTRSPIERSRSPRGRSPAIRVGYRLQEKKRKRDDPPHGRTPPPPPKLSSSVGKKRGDTLSHRQYFEELDKRPLEHGHGFDYRHKPSFPPSHELSRVPWQPSYPKDPRRVNAAPPSSQSYPDPRYSGGYQFPPSSLTVPPRSYYPEFGKPYGHY